MRQIWETKECIVQGVINWSTTQTKLLWAPLDKSSSVHSLSSYSLAISWVLEEWTHLQRITEALNGTILSSKFPNRLFTSHLIFVSNTRATSYGSASLFPFFFLGKSFQAFEVPNWLRNYILTSALLLPLTSDTPPHSLLVTFKASTDAFSEHSGFWSAHELCFSKNEDDWFLLPYCRVIEGTPRSWSRWRANSADKPSISFHLSFPFSPTPSFIRIINSLLSDPSTYPTQSTIMASPIHIASSRQAASLTPAEKDSSATPGGSNLFGTTPGGEFCKLLRSIKSLSFQFISSNQSTKLFCCVCAELPSPSISLSLNLTRPSLKQGLESCIQEINFSP